MSQINHHLTDALLMAYSAGTLPEAFSLVVATHISMCDECRARAGSFDSVGGQLLDSASGEALSDDALAATLRLIGGAAPEPRAPSTRRAPSTFPLPLQAYVGGDVDAVRWKRLGGGVRQMILPSSSDASVRLLYIPGGAAVPDHGHRGTELTLVLQGAFRDETDRFGVGDIEVATEDLEHKPVAEPGVACICLAATDAPLKFNSMIPRMLQPLFRI
jgi:putative transcriptional regulator